MEDNGNKLCSWCKKNKPKYNLQKVWVKWDYDPDNDEYDNMVIEDCFYCPPPDENLFLCEECYEQW